MALARNLSMDITAEVANAVMPHLNPKPTRSPEAACQRSRSETRRNPN